MTTTRWVPWFLAALLPAAADEVRLVRGGRIEGRIVDEGERVLVETRVGRVSVPRAEVASVTRVPGDLDVYEERRSKIADDDTAGLFRLAEWCSERGLGRQVRELCERVVEIDPDHEGARRRLGFRRFQGRWLTGDEFWAAQGYVRWQGRWVTPAEAELLRAREEEQRLVARAAAEERTRLREEAARLRYEAARDARIEADLQQARAQAAARNEGYSRPGYGCSSGYSSYYPVILNPSYVFPSILAPGNVFVTPTPRPFCATVTRTSGGTTTTTRVCF